MIRIVDILRKAEELANPKNAEAEPKTPLPPPVSIAPVVPKETKPPVASSELPVPKPQPLITDFQQFYKEAAAALKSIISRTEADETAAKDFKAIIASTEQLVNQHKSGSINGLTNLLNSQAKNEEAITNALKVTSIAIRMGIDIAYTGQELVELAIAAVIHDLEMSKQPVVVLRALASRQFNLNSDEYSKIINLAELYPG